MISSVTVENVRNQTRTVSLVKNTLLYGANGSGKSTIAHAINLALLGYLPGYNKNTVFQNASDLCMSVSVVLDKHTITRKWTLGKTLSESVKVNGVEAKGNGSDAMIALATGGIPVVVDLPSFWAMSPTEKRRAFIKMVGGGMDVEKLMADEARAREEKNVRTRDRQAAEKTVSQLTQSLAGIEKPTGNLEQLQKELAEAEALWSELDAKIKNGQAADRLREQYKQQLQSSEEAGKKLEELRQRKEQALIKVQALDSDIAALVEKKPPEPPEATPALAGPHADTVMLCLSLIEKDLFPMKLSKVARKAIEVLQKMLKSMLETPEEVTVLKENHAKYLKRMVGLEQARKQADMEYASALSAFRVAEGAAQSASKTAEAFATLGAGVDQADVAKKNGIQDTIAKLKAGIAPLQKVAVIQAEIEKAKIAANKAEEAEGEAKKALEAAISAQAEAIGKLDAVLQQRSAEVLPDGYLVLADDGGKQFDVNWKRGDLVINRNTLSGGEQCVFDAALGHAMCPGAMLILEAAEIDVDRFPVVLNKLGELQEQVLVMTCHEPAPMLANQVFMAKGWGLVRTGSHNE